MSDIHAYTDLVNRHDVSSQTQSLIELFSPRSAQAYAPSTVVEQDSWQADDTHRVNNIVQLFQSLQRIAAKIPGRHDPIEVSRQAAELAAAYTELSQSGEPASIVACAKLLRQIVSGLIGLFEPARGAILLNIAIDPLSLSRDKRRALILIASELIINALKYAFPSGKGGEIWVSLRVDGDWVEMMIRDNGIGLSGNAAVGSGTGLIDQLCNKLDARIDRTSPQNGLRASVIFRNRNIVAFSRRAPSPKNA